ncbi:MAG: HPr family phosphocarrier protein [Gammaproteobacteria bacterium]|nr:MAG: HPr family phosphocarrier protein [Gammaproteobacteria bacterium]
MVRRELEIVNRLGLHARAASRFVQLAARFRCEVRLRHGGQEANGKSILGVMRLAAARGARLELLTEGPDEEAAAEALAALVAGRFGEPE